MKIKNFIYTVFLSLFFFKGSAQTAVLRKADKDYNQYAYIDAITIYEKIAEKGYQDETMFQRLGNAYYFNASLPNAEKWYEALFAMNIQQEAEYYYRYAQSLKSVGDYAKADKMLDIFYEKTKNDSRGILFEENKNYLEQIKNNSGRFEIANAGINSNQSDYGSSFLGNKLVFASARDTGIAARKIFKWTNKSFTNLYSSVVKADGTIDPPSLFVKKLNTKFNESTPVFTKDGKTMYFTRNNYLDGIKGKDDKKVTLLKLYKANLVDHKWTNIVELPFNSDQFSVAHPALSVDEKKLYFASDMPGTLGQSDLFSVVINDDGTYGKPENLGSAINTEGRETFPYISGDNELYFATDGRPGLGGLDIFVTKIKEDSGFSKVQNIGEPVNTKYDDFAFIIDNKTRNGFFSSNKEGGMGNDDIYKFTETKKLVNLRFLSGIITDSKTNEVIADAKVVLLDDKFQVLAGADGTYKFDIKDSEFFYVRASKNEYQTKESSISFPVDVDVAKLDLKLDKQMSEIKVGTDLAKALDIKSIYFDLGKSIIREKAAFELHKIVAVMKQYPKMKISVRSHTDSRQSKQSNLLLSDKRAKATVKWIVENGIEANRISGKGYGESQLLNECADGVKCSEEKHQLNRRSEFIVLSID
jgi:outer membrane protein OmpA-like peptidoglycan-associated protein